MPIDIYELDVVDLAELVNDFVDCKGNVEEMKREFKNLTIVSLLELSFMYLLASDFFSDMKPKPQ